MKQAVTSSVYNGNFKRIQWRATGYRAYDAIDSPILVQLPGEQDIQAQEHIITLNPGDKFINYREIYRKRASSYTSNLVNVLSAELLNEKYTQKMQCQIIRVRTQRIPWRLSNCQKLSVQQGLCILYGACSGYSQLLLHFRQPFLVSHDMIGMNIYGTIKVWLNPNFSLNALVSEQSKLSSIDAMKTNIIQLIQEKLQSKSFPMRIQLLNCPNLSWLIVKIQTLLKEYKQDQKQITKNVLKKFKGQPETFSKKLKPQKISLTNSISAQSFKLKKQQNNTQKLTKFPYVQKSPPYNPENFAKLQFNSKENFVRSNILIQESKKQDMIISKLEQSYYDLSPTRVHKHQNSKVQRQQIRSGTKLYKKPSVNFQENKKFLQQLTTESNSPKQLLHTNSNNYLGRQKSYSNHFPIQSNNVKIQGKIIGSIPYNKSSSMLFKPLSYQNHERFIPNKGPPLPPSLNISSYVSPRNSYNIKTQREQNQSMNMTNNQRNMPRMSERFNMKPKNV